MPKVSKKHKAAIAAVDRTKFYPVSDAAKLLKDVTYTKFDSSIEMHVRLGVDTIRSYS